MQPAAAEPRDQRRPKAPTIGTKPGHRAVLAAVALQNGKNDEAIELFTKADPADCPIECRIQSLVRPGGVLNAGVNEGALEQRRAVRSR